MISSHYIILFHYYAFTFNFNMIKQFYHSLLSVCLQFLYVRDNNWHFISRRRRCYIYECVCVSEYIRERVLQYMSLTDCACVSEFGTYVHISTDMYTCDDWHAWKYGWMFLSYYIFVIVYETACVCIVMFCISMIMRVCLRMRYILYKALTQT